MIWTEKQRQGTVIEHPQADYDDDDKHGDGDDVFLVSCSSRSHGVL